MGKPATPLARQPLLLVRQPLSLSIHSYIQARQLLTLATGYFSSPANLALTSNSHSLYRQAPTVSTARQPQAELGLDKISVYQFCVFHLAFVHSFCFHKSCFIIILSIHHVYNPCQCAGVSIILFWMIAKHCLSMAYCNATFAWGPHISRGVSEIYGLGGPNISKYLDRGERKRGGPNLS